MLWMAPLAVAQSKPLMPSPPTQAAPNGQTVPPAGANNVAPAESVGVPAPPGTSAPPAPTGQKGAKYVGNDVCKACHQAEFDQYQSSPHAKTMLKAHAAPGTTGCEACHGPGGNHVQNPGDLTTIFDFKNAPADAVSERCLGCHGVDHEKADFGASAHAENHISCVDCHSSHHPVTVVALLKAPQPNLCYSCHADKRAQFDMPSHHKVNEGMVQCSDCHNPHGTAQPVMLRTSAAADAVCYTCHAEKRGPFVFEHAPVKIDGCLDCHNPHGSSNLHLLKVSEINILCLQCHTASSFSSAPGTPSFHNMTAQYNSCLSCHTQIHGSNFSPYFFY